jgi:hypothetical protein
LVDHIDRNPLNNTRANLRFCTHSENQRNKASKPLSTSKYLGVHWHKKDCKWQATIRVEGKKVYLGSFKSEEDAARAYDAAAREHHGQFANPNFKEIPA